MTEYATIVNATSPDRLGRCYYADVVRGSIESYHPSSAIRCRAWTAAGAKRRGDRRIRRMARAAARRTRRDYAARKVTGYS